MRHGVNNLQDYRISSYVRTIVHTRYFTSDNEPEGIENATHNTLGSEPGYGRVECPSLL
jgi:hypothetical protein